MQKQTRSHVLQTNIWKKMIRMTLDWKERNYSSRNKNKKIEAAKLSNATRSDLLAIEDKVV